MSVWNSFTIPVEIAFKSDIFQLPSMIWSNYVIDIFFFFDIILNFMTTFINPLTGNEEIKPYTIRKKYLQGTFLIDLLTIIPFDAMSSNSKDDSMLKSFSILKLLRVLRLSRIIQYMNTTDEIKHTLKLFKLVFMILLYINFSACFWYTLSYNDY